MKRVLVVDDEAPMLAALADVLEILLGYSVDAAQNAEEALAILRACRTAFDVLIIDRTLPGINGEELIIRLAELWPATPVVLMTGGITTGFPLPTSAGPIRHLKKPFTSRELGRVLDELVPASDL
ncbi:MAG: response regulator [Acidimicrobiales bacterium]